MQLSNFDQRHAMPTSDLSTSDLFAVLIDFMQHKDATRARHQRDLLRQNEDELDHHIAQNNGEGK
jgi:hypothetical protein